MDSDSDNDSIDQLEEFRKANVKPGMFVSGWEDPNDEIFEDKEPHCKFIRFSRTFNHNFYTKQPHWNGKCYGQRMKEK